MCVVGGEAGLRQGFSTRKQFLVTGNCRLRKRATGTPRTRGGDKQDKVLADLSVAKTTTSDTPGNQGVQSRGWMAVMLQASSPKVD